MICTFVVLSHKAAARNVSSVLVRGSSGHQLWSVWIKQDDTHQCLDSALAALYLRSCTQTVVLHVVISESDQRAKCSLLLGENMVPWCNLSPVAVTSHDIISVHFHLT